MVKILLDEPCYGLASYLSKRGYPTVNAERQTGDEAIVKKAKVEKYVLVTKDEGLKKMCEEADVPCVYLADQEAEAEQVHNFISKMQAFKEYV